MFKKDVSKVSLLTSTNLRTAVVCDQCKTVNFIPVRNVHMSRTIFAVLDTLCNTTGLHSSSNNTHCNVRFTIELDALERRSC